MHAWYDCIRECAGTLAPNGALLTLSQSLRAITSSAGIINASGSEGGAPTIIRVLRPKADGVGVSESVNQLNCEVGERHSIGKSRKLLRADTIHHAFKIKKTFSARVHITSPKF